MESRELYRNKRGFVTQEAYFPVEALWRGIPTEIKIQKSEPNDISVERSSVHDGQQNEPLYGELVGSTSYTGRR